MINGKNIAPLPSEPPPAALLPSQAMMPLSKHGPLPCCPVCRQARQAWEGLTSLGITISGQEMENHLSGEVLSCPLKMFQCASSHPFLLETCMALVWRRESLGGVRLLAGPSAVISSAGAVSYSQHLAHQEGPQLPSGSLQDSLKA